MNRKQRRAASKQADAIVPTSGAASADSAVVVPPAEAPKAPAAAPPPDNAILELVRREKPATPAAMVDLLADLFLQGDLAADERKKLVDFAAAGEPKDAERDKRIRETAHALMTMAEFTLA